MREIWGSGAYLGKILLALVIGAGLAGCADDDDNRSPLPPATSTQAVPVATATRTLTPAVPATATPTATQPATATATAEPTATATATVEPTATATVAGGRVVNISPGANDQETLLLALIEARRGDIIQLAAGTYNFNGQLSLDVDDVTLRGAGMTETILSFAGQTSGAEGLLVQADGFVIEDLAIEDTPGDLLKILGCDGLTIRRVRGEWTNGPDSGNGAYGFYPIECRDVLIEESIVIGASDAGIYVGQCENVIVRRNLAQYNVAGIEIENTVDADVYENLAINNTGGLLVFNLPGLPFVDGRRTRVYDNLIYANNTPNFAPPGTTVSAVQAGTGLMILANDDVEVFRNEFRDNGTAHVLLISFNTAALIGGFRTSDPNYDKWSEGIFLTDNEYSGGGTSPDPATRELIGGIVGGVPFPDILFDGDIDRRKLVDGSLPPALRSCVQEENATFYNIDLSNAGAGASPDLGPFDCTLERLPMVTIPGVGEPSGPIPTPQVTDTPAPTATPTPGRIVQLAPGANDQDTILLALIDARPGDVIELAAGTYNLTGQLSLDVDDVTLRGQGMEETILSFAGQTSGAEGLLVNADRFVIEDLAIEDSPGDLLKVLGCEDLIIRRVRGEWTNGPDANNGAYGFYPIECRNVLIEDSIVRGASDAGIYVGQCHGVVVRGNTAEFNVAGIEIENTTDADVYDNLATNNTGGLLVFNLPGLPFVDGRRTRVYENRIYANNTPNFAPPGTTVSAVPAGTGVMILANDEIEIFANDFRDNGTTHILAISFNTAALVGGFRTTDPNYDKYSESLFILDNDFSGGGTAPDPAIAELIGGIVGGTPFPDILFDGDVDNRKFVDGMLPEALRLCIQAPAATFYDIDLRNGGGGASNDKTPFACTHPRLPAVSLGGLGD